MSVCGGLILLLAGCRREAAPPPAAAPVRPLVVFATLYPLADLARQIGGDAVRVDWLLDLGDPIDHYALTRRERDRMSAADLILCDSLARTETWAQPELGRLRDTGNVLAVDAVPPARDAAAAGLLLLDPTVAAAYVDTLTDALARRLPGRAGAFRDNARALQTRIAATAATFSAPKGAKVLTLAGTFDPLLARLGVERVSVDADVLDLTDAAVDALRRRARATGLRTALIPYDTPPGTRAAFETRTGLRTVAIDPLGYPNFDHHASYEQVLAYDVEQLKVATQ